MRNHFEKKSIDWLLSWLKGQMDTTIYTGMLLTHHWLIWARSGDISGLRLTAASLVSIQVRIFTSVFTKDTGLEVIGYIGDSPHRVWDILTRHVLSKIYGKPGTCGRLAYLDEQDAIHERYIERMQRRG